MNLIFIKWTQHLVEKRLWPTQFVTIWVIVSWNIYFVAMNCDYDVLKQRIISVGEPLNCETDGSPVSVNYFRIWIVTYLCDTFIYKKIVIYCKLYTLFFK